MPRAPLARPEQLIPRLAGRASLFDLGWSPAGLHAGGCMRAGDAWSSSVEVQDPDPGAARPGAGDAEEAGHFLLCGDSNQIVHPNFFSWSQVKSLFWRDRNWRGGRNWPCSPPTSAMWRGATRVANTLLKIKHRRFRC